MPPADPRFYETEFGIRNCPFVPHATPHRIEPGNDNRRLVGPGA
jgi:hypothetical protein